MKWLHELLKVLDDVKEVLIAVTSTVSVAAVCFRIIADKIRPKK